MECYFFSNVFLSASFISRQMYEQPPRGGARLQLTTHFIGYSSFCFDSWHWKTHEIWIRSVAAEIRKAIQRCVVRSEVSVFIAQLPAPDVDTRMNCDVHWYVSYNACLTNCSGARRLLFLVRKDPSWILYDLFSFFLAANVTGCLQRPSSKVSFICPAILPAFLFPEDR